jgi:hypothetical protein
MKQSLFFLGGLLAGPAVSNPLPQAGAGDTAQCAPMPSPWPGWNAFPAQTTLPDPFLPPIYMTTAGSDGASAADIAQGRGKHRIETREQWYKCQQPQLRQMLQEYQFGYYPDHSKEKVEATKSGNNLNIKVTAGGKTGSFSASVTLPSGTGPFPVVINIGGMSNQPYLQAGIAIAQFNYGNVAGDNNSKKGTFWDIYAGQDIGKSLV